MFYNKWKVICFDFQDVASIFAWNLSFCVMVVWNVISVSVLNGAFLKLNPPVINTRCAVMREDDCWALIEHTLSVSLAPERDVGRGFSGNSSCSRIRRWLEGFQKHFTSRPVGMSPPSAGQTLGHHFNNTEPRGHQANPSNKTWEWTAGGQCGRSRWCVLNKFTRSDVCHRSHKTQIQRKSILMFVHRYQTIMMICTLYFISLIYFSQLSCFPIQILTFLNSFTNFISCLATNVFLS